MHVTQLRDPLRAFQHSITKLVNVLVHLYIKTVLKTSQNNGNTIVEFNECYTYKFG